MGFRIGNTENSGYGNQGRRRGFKFLPIVIFGVFALIYYFGNRDVVPITGRSHVVGMSTDQEMQLGLQSYREVLNQNNVVTDGKYPALVKSVGERIAKVAENNEFEWEFNVLESPEINAFCLPGGKVAVYTGILPVAQDEDGLAVIMGHEISHALARHGAERMAHQRLAQLGQLALGMSVSDMDEGQRRAVMGAFGLGAQYGFMLPFSREHESEADYMGLILMARACFDPNKAPLFWERMAESASRSGQPPEFMSTHPSSDTRIQQLREWMPKAMEERAKFCGDLVN